MSTRPAPASRLPLSIVVPTRNRPQQLAGCLRALAAAVGPEDEILVVDSASDDPAAVRAVTESAGVRIVRVDLPGASRARNAGWRAARHQLVLFTDDDCRPRPGWADAYAIRLRDEPAGTVVSWGPVLVAREGTSGAPDLAVDAVRRVGPGDDVGPLGHSANLAVRRAALEQVGGFDEVLGAGTALRAAEDKDLLLRLLATGAQGIAEPAAQVEHEVWRSRLGSLRLQHHYGLGQGALGAKSVLLLGPTAAHRAFPDGRARTHLRAAAADLRAGYRTGLLSGLLRTAGVLRGRWAVRGVPVRDGHLRPGRLRP